MLIRQDSWHYLSIDFQRSYDTEDNDYEFVFKIQAQIDGFTYGKEYHNPIVCVSDTQLSKFVQELERLNSSLDGVASVKSTHANFELKIQSYKEPYSSEHGYLLVWVSIKYQAPNVFSDVENLFEGYLVVEPAKLSDWIDELREIHTERPGFKQPAQS